MDVFTSLSMTRLSDPKDIELYRLKTLRAALKLEIYGMHKAGKSAYAILKDEFGFKGTKQQVFESVSKQIFVNSQIDLPL